MSLSRKSNHFSPTGSVAVMLVCGQRGNGSSQGSTRTRGLLKYLGGKLILSVVGWRNRGLMDNPQLRHFFGARKYFGGVEFASGGVA
eukprot:5549524-Pyramimonas_sp.AAC.1